MAPGVPKYEINLAMWKTSGATSLGPRLLKWQILVLYRTVGEGEGGYMEYYSGYGFYEACGKFSRLKNYAWLFFFRRDMDIAH